MLKIPDRIAAAATKRFKCESGMALVIFTFGFGGLEPFAKIFSGLLFLSCVIELLLGLIYRNKNNGECPADCHTLLLSAG